MVVRGAPHLRSTAFRSGAPRLYLYPDPATGTRRRLAGGRCAAGASDPRSTQPTAV